MDDLVHGRPVDGPRPGQPRPGQHGGMRDAARKMSISDLILRFRNGALCSPLAAFRKYLDGHVRAVCARARVHACATTQVMRAHVSNMPP